jgi:hypothetical protein
MAHGEAEFRIRANALIGEALGSGSLERPRDRVGALQPFSETESNGQIDLTKEQWTKRAIKDSYSLTLTLTRQPEAADQPEGEERE